MIIRKMCIGDAKALSHYFLDNSDHFRDWEPMRSRGVHTIASWSQRLIEREQAHRDLEAAYFIALEECNPRVLGHCSLTNIMYGPFQACFMGYGVSHCSEGKSIMFELCNSTINFAFSELGLHRVMAAYMPRNKRSERLLNRLGFEYEGLAKCYLKINGRWEDHILTSLINPNTDSNY